MSSMLFILLLLSVKQTVCYYQGWPWYGGMMLSHDGKETQYLLHPELPSDGKYKPIMQRRVTPDLVATYDKLQEIDRTISWTFYGSDDSGYEHLDGAFFVNKIDPDNLIIAQVVLLRKGKYTTASDPTDKGRESAAYWVDIDNYYIYLDKSTVNTVKTIGFKGLYHEKQFGISGLCGRCALNSLFQNQEFTKVELESIREQIGCGPPKTYFGVLAQYTTGGAWPKDVLFNALTRKKIDIWGYIGYDTERDLPNWWPALEKDLPQWFFGFLLIGSHALSVKKIGNSWYNLDGLPEGFLGGWAGLKGIPDPQPKTYKDILDIILTEVKKGKYCYVLVRHPITPSSKIDIKKKEADWREMRSSDGRKHLSESIKGSDSDLGHEVELYEQQEKPSDRSSGSSSMNMLPFLLLEFEMFIFDILLIVIIMMICCCLGVIFGILIHDLLHMKRKINH
eukprot:389906_1